MDVSVVLFAAVVVTYVEGFCPYLFSSNILLNKGSQQNHANRGDFDEYGPRHGNDGETSSMIGTGLADESFWQGDLQGSYMVFTITLISSNADWVWNDHLRNAYIGVSVLDKTCPGSDAIICGQWPNQTLTSATRTFDCTLSHPVRFVKVWKEVRGHLGFSEVKARGKKIGMEFVLKKSQKVTTTYMSLFVPIAAECASVCFNTHLCIAFSFRQGGQLNCLLATKLAMTSDTDWVTYTIKHC